MSEKENSVDKSIAHSGQSKAERYNWPKIGPRGELQWIDKLKLNIDHQYQREGLDRKGLEIASDFEWPAFGCLVVGRRDDGSLWVIDGQHRLIAALRRDVDQVPCIVFGMQDIRAEALAFLRANTFRRPVSAVEKHRATLCTDDPIAPIIDELVQASGRKVGRSSSPTTVACIKAMRLELDRKDGEDVVRTIWPLMTALCQGRIMHEKLFLALCYVQRNSDGLSSKLQSRLRSIGFDKLLDSMAAAERFLQKAGPKVSAEGVVNALNRNVKAEYRFRLRESGSE